METQEALRILDITGSVNINTVRSAYVRLVKKYHPDLARSEQDRISYTKIIIDVNDAYSTLVKALKNGTSIGGIDVPQKDGINTDEQSFDVYRIRMQSISQYIKGIPDETFLNRDYAETVYQQVIDMTIHQENMSLTYEQDDILQKRARLSPCTRAGATCCTIFGHGFDERHDGLTADDYVLLHHKTDRTRCESDTQRQTATRLCVLYDTKSGHFYWCNADFSDIEPPVPTVSDVMRKRVYVIPERNAMNAIDDVPKPAKKRSPFSAIGSFFRR